VLVYFVHCNRIERTIMYVTQYEEKIAQLISVFICSFNKLTDYVSALKPGRVARVNRVTFCPGHPGQTRFKDYPGLTRIGSRETQN